MRFGVLPEEMLELFDTDKYSRSLECYSDHVLSEPHEKLHLWAWAFFESVPFNPFFQQRSLFDWALHRQSAFIHATISFSQESDPWVYALPLREAFDNALKECRYVSIDADVVAGAPRISGTRVPVYAVLEAIARNGTVEGTLQSFPQLSREQVKDALDFARIVVECPIEQ